jgi:tRNA(Ile)-lysidine synthase TilS/MesJ
MDQAETVLLHLMRGAGLRGAAGMAECSEITVPWWRNGATLPVQRLRLWRPFLSESRDVVRNYAELTGFDPIEDETNESTIFQRNAIRRRLLPVMEQLSPGAEEALARFAALAHEDNRYLASQAQKVLAVARSGPLSLAIDPLVRAPLSLRRRAVLIWLSDISDIEPSQDRIDAILQLLMRRRSRPAIEIGGGYVATISGDDVVIQRS